MVDDKEDNHELSPLLCGCIGKHALIIVLRRNTYSVPEITVHLNIKYVLYRRGHVYGTIRIREKLSRKANPAEYAKRSEIGIKQSIAILLQDCRTNEIYN
jgi:hypothetical protein